MKPSAKLLSIVLLFAGLVLVNYLASQLPFRGDNTAEKIYTLSDGTRSLLSKIEDPISIDFYFTNNAKGLPISYKNYAARVEEMLRQYTRAARGRISLNIIHPEVDTPEEEQATRAGLQPQIIPGSGERLYFGLSATQADLQETIVAFNPQREQFLEYDLSQLIHSVQIFEKRRLGLLSSLPLKAAPPNPMMMQMGQRPQPDQFIISEWSKTFEIVEVDATADELPANLDALAVIHPQGLSQKLEYAIDQYLLRGRPVFLALDPSSEHFKRQQPPQQQMMMGGPQPNVASDLPRLLGAYGIEFDTANVTGDLRYAAQVQVATGTLVRYPIWLNLPAESLNRETMATAELDNLLWVESGHIALNASSVLDFTPLVSTSEEAGDIATMMLQFAQPESIAGQIEPDGSRTLAALVTGTFSSAFPNGPPADEPATDGDNASPAPAAPVSGGLASGEGTLMIVADTDWLMDGYSVRRMNFLGVQTAEPLNDNLAFATNALEFLAGSQDLISIRGKGSSLRPFTVVRDMEAEAQQRYQEQLEALDGRLREVQQQISELQSQTGERGLLVASPEVAETIAEYQAQEVEMRRERRDIRRALREDIDALETRLLLLNLFAAPIIVGVFGIWFHRQRRQ